MLDLFFCEVLEYKLCEAFSVVDDQTLKGFWCDGVLLFEDNKYYSHEFVSKNKQVRMQAFVGKDGQTVYTLIVNFGKKAILRYATNLSIVECIPKTDSITWIKVNTLKKEIEIQLD